MGTTSPSCNARSSLACSGSGISAISSSSSVPPSAARKKPSLAALAPVKAPLVAEQQRFQHGRAWRRSSPPQRGHWRAGCDHG
jgi:hypothetical protein